MRSVYIGILAIYYYYIYKYLTTTPTSEAPYTFSEKVGKGKPKLASNSYVDFKSPPSHEKLGKENATIVMLVRNRELESALSSMRSLEDRFNRNYHYPWVFLNDVPFTQEFIDQTRLMASGEVFHELIPADDWNPPPYIDEEKLNENLVNSSNVIYGGSRSYRNMCHFNSGFFFRQKKLMEYDWYFRVEPDVQYLCDFDYDPFTYLRETGKIYGFVTAIHEYENTIPTLWPTVEKFMSEYPHLLHPNNSLDYITTNETELNYLVPLVNSSSSYNLCHFWSNFEIGNLNFWRSEAYLTYFNYLSKSGGFHYERWGDAPIHSIGLNLLADKSKIHHFDDIGYYHAPYMACPTSKDLRTFKRCICKAEMNGEIITEPYDVSIYSCLSRWWRYGSGKKFISEVDYHR